MQLVDVTYREPTETLGSDDDIDCEFMVCHLAVGAKHGAVE